MLDKVFDNTMSLRILDYFVLDRKGKHVFLIQSVDTCNSLG
jgi:hypothetical protein